MRPISLHHLVVPEITAVDLVWIAAKLGCQHVCVFTQDPGAGTRFPIIDDAQIGDVARAMRDAGISAYGATSFGLAPDTRISDYAPALERAARLGATSANARLIEPDDARVTDMFAQFVALALAHGIVGGIEFMGYGNRDALPRALRVVAAAGAGRIAVDALHLVRTGASIDDLRAIRTELIGYVQLCDGPLIATAQDYAREGAFDRLAPGEGEFPLRELLALLPADQPVSIEVPTTSLRERGWDAARRARYVVEKTKQLLASH